MHALVAVTWCRYETHLAALNIAPVSGGYAAISADTLSNMPVNSEGMPLQLTKAQLAARRAQLGLRQQSVNCFIIMWRFLMFWKVCTSLPEPVLPLVICATHLPAGHPVLPYSLFNPESGMA